MYDRQRGTAAALLRRVRQEPRRTSWPDRRWTTRRSRRSSASGRARAAARRCGAARRAGCEFDMDEVRHGQLSPVFFGSALTNFGVEPFLEEFLRMTPPPLPRDGRLRRDRHLRPRFLGLRLQNSGEHEQGPPRPAGVSCASAPASLSETAEYYHVQGGQEDAPFPAAAADGARSVRSSTRPTPATSSACSIPAFSPSATRSAVPGKKFTLRRHPDLRAGAFLARRARRTR